MQSAGQVPPRYAFAPVSSSADLAAELFDQERGSVSRGGPLGLDMASLATLALSALGATTVSTLQRWRVREHIFAESFANARSEQNQDDRKGSVARTFEVPKTPAEIGVTKNQSHRW
jgi:hypothetical protein